MDRFRNYTVSIWCKTTGRFLRHKVLRIEKHCPLKEIGNTCRPWLQHMAIGCVCPPEIHIKLGQFGTSSASGDSASSKWPQ